jgi:hypothetical protein
MGAFESHGGAICAPLSASPERHGRRLIVEAQRRVGADFMFWRPACLAPLMRTFDSHGWPICGTRSAAAPSRPAAKKQVSRSQARWTLVSAYCSVRRPGACAMLFGTTLPTSPSRRGALRSRTRHQK